MLWITANDATDHAVNETAHDAGVASAIGKFEAVCGVRFLVAPMVEPPGKLCPRCRAFLHTRAMLQQELSRRPSLLARLLIAIGRRLTPITRVGKQPKECECRVSGSTATGPGMVFDGG